MSESVDFSVIIPVYKGEAYILRALECVKNQIYQNFEIVICDDESPDRSAAIINEYIRNNPDLKIRYIYQKNKGLGGARNTAIKASQGKYIALLDQDDIWHPNKLEKVKKLFAAQPEISLVCHNEAIRQGDKILFYSSYGPIGERFYRQLLLNKNCLSTSASCFTLEAIKDVNYFSEDLERIHFVEDYDLWLRMAKKGYKFAIINEILGDCIIHENNFSSSNLKIMYQHELNVLQDHWVNYGPKKWTDYYFFQKRIARLNLALGKDSLKNQKIYQALPYFAKAFCANPMIVFHMIRKII